MQIPKISSVICALTFVAATTSLAADTPAQAAARQALEEKLKELGAQTPPPQAAAPVVVEPAPVVKPRADVGTKAKKESAKVTTKHKKEQEAVVVAPANAAKPVVNTKSDWAAAPVATSSATTAVSLPAASADNEAQAKAREALAKELNKLQESQPAATTPAQPVVETPVVAKPAPAPVAKPVAAKPVVAKPSKPVQRDYVGKDIGLKPISAPELPITASKEEQLQALLAKYKADQISPEEYHKQRAAILAQP